MKKTFIFAAAAALSIFASCQKEVIEAPSTDSNGDLVFTATIDVQDSKTTIDALTGKVAWVKGDTITINDCNSTSAKYTVTAIEGDTLAIFTKIKGELDLGDGPYDAIYGTNPVAGQIYSATVPALPMSAHSETTRLKFTVTCGLLELGLKAGESVTSIEVTGTPAGESETTYTLTCPTAVSIADSATFFVALPAGNYTKFKINGQNGAECTKETTGSVVEIQENHITPVSFSKPLRFMVQLWADGPYFATTNIGAYKPEDCGQYFAWGYTTGYTHNGSAWTDGVNTKTFDPTGFSDYQTHTYADMAAANWGAEWSVPTKDDLNNLISNSYTEIEYVKEGSAHWSTYNVKGILLTGNTTGYTSNSIFLPAAGCGSGSNLINEGLFGHYWSSVQLSGNNAYYLYFRPEDGIKVVFDDLKYFGFSVRPVYSPVKVESVSIKDVYFVISVGEQYNLAKQTTVLPEGAVDKSLSWSSDNTAVATVSDDGVVTGVAAGTATITATAKDGSGVKGQRVVNIRNYGQKYYLQACNDLVTEGGYFQSSCTFVLDQTDYLTGTACHKTMNAGEGMIIHQRTTPNDPVNCKDVTVDNGVVVIHLYVGDAAKFDGAAGNFEFSSSGECDTNELSWTWTDLAKFANGNSGVTGKKFKTGWNVIELPLSVATPAGTTDLSNVNFYRMFETSEVLSGMELKIDTIYITYITK